MLLTQGYSMPTIHSQFGQSSGSGIFVNYPRLTGFTITEHLHTGPHGSIYRARQDRLGRIVALKMMPEWPPASDEALERFNRATYVNAQVLNPHLLTLYEAGTKDGYHYAVSEFVSGQTLGKHLSVAGQTDESFAIRVGLQAARALVALHARDICHRNVKPKNIFIEADGRVRLIGLGLASCKNIFYSPQLDEHAIGTPHFMAPEMIRGCYSDPRSDLYSLGVTLYFMTAGCPPYERGVPAVVMSRHLTEEPVSLARTRPDLSAGFVSLVKRLMAKDPDDRPQSAFELVLELESFARTVGVEMAAVSAKSTDHFSLFKCPVQNSEPVRVSADVGRKWMRPFAIGATSVVLILGVLGLCTAQFLESPEEKEFQRLEMNDALLGDPQTNADGYAEFLNKFPEASPVHRALVRRRMEFYRAQLLTETPGILPVEPIEPENFEF